MNNFKLGLALLLANVFSIFNSWLAYKCVVGGHRVFAVVFIVMAFWTSFAIERRR